MIRIGLTGGIGCGKTTVLREFERLGARIFSADEVASHYYEDENFKHELRSIFGPVIFHQDGSVDKKAIAQLVFADKGLLSALNALVHPRVIADFEEVLRSGQGRVNIVFESAILYDYGFDKMMDSVVCVYLDHDERVRRLMIRDNSTRQQIEARMRNQLPAEYAIDKADYVVLNYEGNPRRRQVEYIYSQIISNQ
ncbi:MAG: dephospho-CoA kinase [Bacteroidales bacterium]|nr:dephospho-CoA kinase [Bacteroidales bacterium]